MATVARETGWLVVALILLTGIVVAARPKQIEMTENKTWFHVTHESGVEYVIRSSGVIAFMDPVPGDPRDRNGVMLSNGKVMMTNLELEEFVDLLLDVHNVKIEKINE